MIFEMFFSVQINILDKDIVAWHRSQVSMVLKTMRVKPAAGLETASCESLSQEAISPPKSPPIMPDHKGAPDASVIPKHKGIATKNTTMPAGMSSFK